MNTRAAISMPENARPARGLTLIEMLVTVTLLVIIILGLTAMFIQTRKAFTVGLGNVEYQDAGRVAMDMITRELQQMTPSDYAVPSFDPRRPITALNFYADISPYFITRTNTVWPMLPNGARQDTTNFSIEQLYFVTRYNQQWNIIGYSLLPSDAGNGVGTLYRFSANNVPLTALLGSRSNAVPNSPFDPFILGPPAPPAGRVIDGVVDFRIRAYDRNGVLISAPPNAPPGMMTSPFSGVPPMVFVLNRQNGDVAYDFSSNAVPAYVEVELGVMETPALNGLSAFTNSPTAFYHYLTNHAAQVHIFRQRVAVAAVDPTAYP